MTHSIIFRRSTFPPRSPRRARHRRWRRRRSENPRPRRIRRRRATRLVVARPSRTRFPSPVRHSRPPIPPRRRAGRPASPGSSPSTSSSPAAASRPPPGSTGSRRRGTRPSSTSARLRRPTPTFIAEATRRGFRYIALPISLKTIDREHLARFNFELALGDARPLYFFDRDGDRAGTLWYLRRITVDRIDAQIAASRGRGAGPLRPGRTWNGRRQLPHTARDGRVGPHRLPPRLAGASGRPLPPVPARTRASLPAPARRPKSLPPASDV